jgi:sulfide:quinone oxidoreductase
MEQTLQKKKILILGAGTAGTMMANRLAVHTHKHNLEITVVDQHGKHYYQPGFLFVPFGRYTEKDLLRTRTDFIPHNVRYIESTIENIDAEKNEVTLNNNSALPYDILIVATGANIAPDQVTNMAGDRYHKVIHDFYTIEGALALREALKTFTGGKLVIHISEMPIKCPVAPLEFAFLADDYFKKKNIRDKVEISYVTPLSGAFTKPEASRVLGSMLSDRNITLIPDFGISEVDEKENLIRSYDEKTVPFDLLVTVPPNMGDALIARSGLGDELNFIPTDKQTLQSQKHQNMFVIGDATNIPASKAGSVAHFEAEILEENILSFLEGKPLTAKFDGHANCYVESGDSKALLVDFGYDIEPVTGEFPLPFFGPFSLLKPTRINHLGKLVFRYIYWNVLMRGFSIPFVGPNVPLAGKNIKK